MSLAPQSILKLGRLPVGKPPKQLGCRHVRRTGANILWDGGFENSTGWDPTPELFPPPWGIPGFGDDPALVYPWLNWGQIVPGDPPRIPATMPPSFWWQEDYGNLNGDWVVSNANPRTGTWHARSSFDSAGNHGTGLHVATGPVCPDNSTLWRSTGAFATWYPFYSAVVLPGDYWELDLWAVASAVGNSRHFEIDVIVSSPDDATSDNDTLIMSNFTTSYANYSVSGVINTADWYGFEPHLLFLTIRTAWSPNSGTLTSLDVDDVGLELTPA